jgi:hypothetical protein
MNFAPRIGQPGDGTASPRTEIGGMRAEYEHPSITTNHITHQTLFV